MSKQRLQTALKDLINRYEAGERTLEAGLCSELWNLYRLPVVYADLVLEQYPEAKYLGPEKFTALGPAGEFTPARYHFCKQVLKDVEHNKWDHLWDIH